jgi:polar amino acid transport system substrate-binding protein
MSISLGASAQTIKLAANEKAVEQAVAMLLIKDIYRKAGLEPQIEALPAKRANQVTLDGSKDGEVARISPYAGNNPPLLRVDPPYYYLSTSAFTKIGRKLVIQTKEDLARYRVGIVRGIAHAERAVEGIPSVTIVDGYSSLYRMIDAGRIDVVIDTGINGQAEIRLLGLESSVGLAGDIAKFDLHHILHPRQKGLIPKISAAIKALQSSGELDALIKKYEKQVVDNWKG